MKKANDKEKKNNIKRLILKPLKGGFISLVFTIVIILILALIAKNAGITDKTISIMNQVVKVLGIVFASFIGSKNMESKTYIAGGFSGGVYILMSYLLFSLLQGELGNFPLLVSDFLMSVLIGIISGVVFKRVLVKRTDK